MSSTIPNGAPSPHLPTTESRPEIRARMAKADVRKADLDDETWRIGVGKAIERTRTLSGLSLKEFAAAVDRDERQVSRWIDAKERPQFDAIFASPNKRVGASLVIALAEMASNVIVETVVRIRA